MSLITIQTNFAAKKVKTETREIAAPFTTGIIDPDWPYTVAPGMKTLSKERDVVPLSGFTRNRDTTANQYKAENALSIEEMGKLPIGELIGGYLFMWTVSPFLLGGVKKSRQSAALYLMEQWGFEPCSMLTWAKYNLERIRNGEPSGGYGGVGFWLLGNAEYVIIGKKPDMPSIRTGYSSLFVEPKQKHSAKPKNVHKLVEARFPGPYVEIFGRYGSIEVPKTKNGITTKEMKDFGSAPKGWTILGDEAPGDGKDIRDSIREQIDTHSQQHVENKGLAPVCFDPSLVV
jgi:N6-adenosine-specific RNA methylase IME4